MKDGDPNWFQPVKHFFVHLKRLVVFYGDDFMLRFFSSHI